MQPIFMRPGEQLRRYDIFETKPKLDSKGKQTYSVNDTPSGILWGSLTKVSMQEIGQWNQKGHTVTHKISVRGITQAKKGDMLNCGGDLYYVHGKENRAMLGMFFTIYCEHKSGGSL